MFLVATEKDILEGKVTDVYFTRTLHILKSEHVNCKVKAEFVAKKLPEDWPWAVLTGLEEVSHVLKRLPVNARAMPEGTVFYPNEPVLEIEGSYLDFCLHETAILGLLCQASGIATKSSRFKKLCGDRLLMSFGARRMHPSLAPMIERNAFVGGCDGVSVIKSGEIIGKDPMGTVPHALIICIGSTVDTLKAFDRVIEPEINRVALIDTFNDEKLECLNAAEALGDKLYAVRFDTPSSRRGDFLYILEEARWELDLRGFEHVKIFVSGGLTEEDVPRLNPIVDAYGIGTSISNAPVVDFSMDIVEVNGKPRAKRGKLSGAKSVLRCLKCHKNKVVPRSRNSENCVCGEKYREILLPFIENGKVIAGISRPEEIRDYALAQTADKTL
ncbi:MAG: nicotinate phosphoribosyltransferase [Halobacteriota archaeon]